MITNRIRGMTIGLLAGLVAFFVATTSQADPEEAAPSFKQALQQHLDAILDKDLDAYVPTLTASDDLMLIFPAGELIDTREGIIEFHRNWFADDNWVMEPEVVKTIVGSDQATAVLRYQYRDTADGEPRSSWLVLVFQLEDDQWRLVHDQNTRIMSQDEGPQDEG